MNKKIYLIVCLKKVRGLKGKLNFLTMLLSLTCAVSVCYGAADMTDNSFGNRGVVETDLSLREDRANAMLIQPDGKIVVGGLSQKLFTISCCDYDYDFALVRYNADGTIDESFGSGGKVITSFGYLESNPDRYDSGRLNSLALQSDGKIVAIGTSSKGFTSVRYNTDGSLDVTYGIAGKVTTAFFDNLHLDGAFSVAIQPNGKIVVAGTAYSDPNQGPFRSALVRYNLDGSLDNTFGNSGKLLTVSKSRGLSGSLNIQPDGKIILGGYTNITSQDTDFSLERYNSDGTLDNSFGNNGIVTTPFGNGLDEILTVNDLSNGKILAIGGIIVNGQYYIALARYNTDGSLDTTFGTSGKVVTNSPSGFYASAIQRDGKIVIVSSTGGNGHVSRFNADGTQDESFGVFGEAWGKENGKGFSVGIQSDGKIVIAGSLYYSGTNLGSNFGFYVHRYLSGQGKSISKFDFDGDGKSDIGVFRPSEGVWYLNQSSSGMSAVRFGIDTDKPVAADYDGDGKTDIAVYRNGMWYMLQSQAGFAAARFGDVNDIPMPADFDGDGKAELVVFRPSNATWYQLNLATNEFDAEQFGQTGDQPFIFKQSYQRNPQMGVFRNGNWRILIKRRPYPSGSNEYSFGDVGDIQVAGDYNGDGHTDLAVFRPSTGRWYYRLFNDQQTAFGNADDTPVPADYDGDGKTDIAVFRNGTWYINNSLQGLTQVKFGATEDKPIFGNSLP